MKGEGNLDSEGLENELCFCHLVARDREPSLYLFKSALPHFSSEGLTWRSALKCREPRTELLQVLLSPWWWAEDGF